MRRLAGLAVLAACAAAPRPFALRPPLARDSDLDPVAVPCHPDPAPGEPHRVTCTPASYTSPFIWDELDNLTFARLDRGLHVRLGHEAIDVNSLDEVPDSAWFTNRPRTSSAHRDDGAPGACTPEDMLPGPDDVADGAWVIDHGKDNGSSHGFRVKIPGKGQYMLKTDDPGHPEQASAASVIGAALYDAVGFHTTCEQIVEIRKGQLKLTPGLTASDNSGVKRPFDDAALDAVLALATQRPGHRVRMQASKWLEGAAIGPFRYEGVRADDPNDIIDHTDRRELRGSRVLAAWMNHWDAREQNSMDVWIAASKHDKRSSPGHVVHYIIDTSDAMGALGGPYEMAVRLGYSYTIDLVDTLRALVTLGLEERPWEHARMVPGREKFGFFHADEFDPEAWIGQYPNPAFLAMTERDGAWMARQLARFSEDDIRRIVGYGAFHDPGDAAYLADVMIARHRAVLARYLGRLSPLGEIRAAAPDRICATDFARLRGLTPGPRYRVVARGGGREIELRAEPGADGEVCVTTPPLVGGTHPDGDPAERVTFTIHTGSGAGPLVIHAYDLGARGMFVAGVDRP